MIGTVSISDGMVSSRDWDGEYFTGKYLRVPVIITIGMILTRWHHLMYVCWRKTNYLALSFLTNYLAIIVVLVLVIVSVKTWLC